MKKILSLVMVLVMCVSMVGAIGVTASAASYPNLSTSAYCEFTAANNMAVYVDANFSRRGTASPWKAYNASVAKNDVCRIYEITKYYVKLGYPTSSGMRTGYVRTSDLFGKNVNPYNSYKATSKVTTYKYKGGGSTGYYENGDMVYLIDGTNYNVIYTAVSGARKYKLAYANNITTNNQNTNTGKLLFPLKGNISRSSSVKTNGYYCDYTTGGSVAVYAPCDGTVTFKQTVHNGRLVSYGNWIEFKSSDGVYKIKLAHLDSFVNVRLNVPSTSTAKLSASDVSGEYTTTLATRTVKQGEKLGMSGKTGNASGHHLHIEVLKNNKAVNPTSVFTAW